jgi:hypothetical protein
MKTWRRRWWLVLVAPVVLHHGYLWAIELCTCVECGGERWDLADGYLSSSHSDVLYIMLHQLRWTANSRQAHGEESTQGSLPF